VRVTSKRRRSGKSVRAKLPLASLIPKKRKMLTKKVSTTVVLRRKPNHLAAAALVSMSPAKTSTSTSSKGKKKKKTKKKKKAVKADANLLETLLRKEKLELKKTQKTKQLDDADAADEQSQDFQGASHWASRVRSPEMADRLNEMPPDERHVRLVRTYALFANARIRTYVAVFSVHAKSNHSCLFLPSTAAQGARRRRRHRRRHGLRVDAERLLPHLLLQRRRAAQTRLVQGRLFTQSLLAFCQ
jgi:hypothetical protein